MMAGAAAPATDMWTLLSLFLFVSALEGCPTVAVTTATPGEIEALKGACLQIPCTYNATKALNSSGEFVGVWLTPPEGTNNFPTVVICNSSVPYCTHQMEIIGDLQQKNCTTVFGKVPTDKNEKIYFRIETSDFLATAACSPLQITIRDSISPKIDIPDDLKEKMTVTITCSAPVPCPRMPPTLAWTLRKNAQNKLEQNGDGTFTVKIQKSITLSEQYDGKNISCSTTYPVDGGVKTTETNTTLSVSYAPKDTLASVSPSAPVSAGSSVTLSCFSRAKPPARFTWFRRSNGGGDSAEYIGDVYTFNVTEGGVYYCVAANNLGNQSSEIRLTLIGEESDMEVIIIAGAAVFILFVFVCALVIFKKYGRSSRPAELMTQSQTEEPAGDQETLHYGEISFNKARPVATPDPAQGDGSQQDTVYAQVRVAAAENTNDIYAQVKKK